MVKDMQDWMRLFFCISEICQKHGLNLDDFLGKAKASV